MVHPHGVLRTGDRATVQLEFISLPDFVEEGMKLLFWKTKVSCPADHILEVCYKIVLFIVTAWIAFYRV